MGPLGPLTEQVTRQTLPTSCLRRDVLTAGTLPNQDSLVRGLEELFRHDRFSPVAACRALKRLLPPADSAHAEQDTEQVHEALQIFLYRNWETIVRYVGQDNLPTLERELRESGHWSEPLTPHVIDREINYAWVLTHILFKS